MGSRVKDGYALIRVGGRKNEGVHRVSYRLAHGEFDPSLHVLHACDTPLCVRPEHLFLGTHTDNMRDAAAKGHLTVERRGRVRDAKGRLIS